MILFFTVFYYLLSYYANLTLVILDCAALRVTEFVGIDNSKFYNLPVVEIVESDNETVKQRAAGEISLCIRRYRNILT